MVIPEDLGDDQECQDIYWNIKKQCGGYGEVLELCVPRLTKKDWKWCNADLIWEAQMVDKANKVGECS